MLIYMQYNTQYILLSKVTSEKYKANNNLGGIQCVNGDHAESPLDFHARCSDPTPPIHLQSDIKGSRQCTEFYISAKTGFISNRH